MWRNLKRCLSSLRSIKRAKVPSALNRFTPIAAGFTLGAFFTSAPLFGESEYFASDSPGKKDKLKLYQYATCPFCCKVRTFMEYYGLEYEIVEVNPMFRNEIKFSEYRKVPIVKYGEKQLNDSSFIISAIQTYLLKNGDIDNIIKCYPIIESTNEKGKVVKEYQNKYNIMYHEGFSKEENQRIRDEIKWRKWVDDIFIHTLSPNIYRTMGESFQALEYITRVGNFKSYERTMAYYSGAMAMYVIGKIVKRRHHLKDDVRQSMFDGARTWTKELGKKKYQGGTQPNLADLNMYGVIHAIEGLDAFNDLMTHTDIQKWYLRMDKQVKSHAGKKRLPQNN